MPNTLVNPTPSAPPRSPTAPFWLVWCPQGCSPTVRHATEAAARQEAMRLAGRSPGEQFYVLKARGLATIAAQPPTYTPVR